MNLDRSSRSSLSIDTAKIQALRLTTFQDKQLMRGSRLSTILLGKGDILKDAEGSASTYSLSSQVDTLDDFVSHNWSTPQGPKFQLLRLHANLDFALLWTAAFLVILVFLLGLGWIPLVSASLGKDITFSPYCLFLGSAVFLLLLFEGHRMKPACLDRICFLDKTCIHQTDEQLKRQGIEALGAFIYNSRNLLIIYADTYLHKLWTVYEFATFMVRSPGKLQVMPLFLPKVIYGGIAINFLFAVFYRLLEFDVFSYNPNSLDTFANGTAFDSFGGVGEGDHEFGGFSDDNDFDSPPDLPDPPFGSSFGGLSTLVMFIGTFLFLAPLAVVCRRWWREQAALFEELANFRVREAKCSVESDRALVNRNIEILMVASRLAHTAEALDAFDELVREEGRDVMKASIGRTGLPYKCQLVIGLATTLTALDSFVEGIHVYRTVEFVTDMSFAVLDLIQGVTTTFFISPMTLGLCCICCQIRLDVTGIKELILEIVLAAIAASVYSFLVIMHKEISSLHSKPNFPATATISVLSAWIAVLAAMTCIMYKPVKVARSVREGPAGTTDQSATSIQRPTSIGAGVHDFSLQPSEDGTSEAANATGACTDGGASGESVNENRRSPNATTVKQSVADADPAITEQSHSAESHAAMRLLTISLPEEPDCQRLTALNCCSAVHCSQL